MPNTTSRRYVKLTCFQRNKLTCGPVFAYSPGVFSDCGGKAEGVAWNQFLPGESPNCCYSGGRETGRRSRPCCLSSITSCDSELATIYRDNALITRCRAPHWSTRHICDWPRSNLCKSKIGHTS